MRILAVLAVVSCQASVSGAHAVGVPGRYSATIETRGGGCCSQSCGAHSTVTSVALELAAGGRARAGWTRSGCSVVESGDGPRTMPFDPGEPSALCGARREVSVPGVKRDVQVLDGAARWSGTWRTVDGADGAEGAVQVELRNEAAPSQVWRLRCTSERAARAGGVGPLLSCTMQDARYEQSAGLEIGGVMYLDSRRGLWVSSVQRGLWGDADVRFQYRGAEVEAP